MVTKTMAHKVSLDAIKAFRETTSASLNDIRQALEASAAECPSSAYAAPQCTCQSRALVALRERGAAMAQKRQGRTTGQGRVESYVHHDGRMASLVEVNCETDFVARTPEFIQFCRDLALHIAATHPRYLRKDNIPESQRAAVDPAQECLLEQPFVKDPSTTINGMLVGLIGKTGENVVIRRFVKFAVGEAEDGAS